MTVFTQLRHQLQRKVTQPLATSPSSPAYRRWRERFTRDRLRLTIGISMVLLTVLAIVNLGVVMPALTNSTDEVSALTLEQYRFYPYVFTAQQLGLGLNLLLLRRRAIASKRLRWHFLGFSTAVLVAPQLLYLLLGETPIDLGGWVLREVARRWEFLR